ncbi:MAG: nitrile hydratase subunit beta [Rhodospirillales bacterium]
MTPETIGCDNRMRHDMTNSSNIPPPRYHDIGGRTAGPVDRTEHVLAPWEKRVDVLRSLLGDKTRRILSTDELRNAIENLGEEPYATLGYYERWMAALIEILKGKGLLTQEEIDDRMDAIRLRLGVENRP